MNPYGSIIWFLGKLITCMSIMASTGSLVYWIFAEKEGAIYHLDRWTDEHLHWLLLTYIYLLSSYGLLFMSTSYIFQATLLQEIIENNLCNVIFFSIVVAAVIVTYQEMTPYRLDHHKVKHWMMFLLSLCMGPSITLFGTHICSHSAVATMAALMLATSIAYTAPEEMYIQMAELVSYIYQIILFVSCIVYLFTPPVTPFSILLLAINFFGGSLLYFLVFIVNTQYVFKEVRSVSNYDPVFNATVMLICTLNLYYRISMYYVVELTDLTSTVPVNRITNKNRL